MADNFKSIIVFNPNKERTLELLEEFKSIPGLQIFKTSSEEEAGQIISMSQKTAVIFDETKMLESKFETRQGRHRKYYLDWEQTSSPAEFQKLRDQNIYPVKIEKTDDIFSMIELYMFGKVNLFKSRAPWVETKPVMIGQGIKAFLTCLELQNTWIPTVSTHYQEENIDELLGKPWEEFLETLTQEEHKAESTIERKTPNKASEFIKFHGQDKVITKILIVHVLSSDEVILDKARAFLKMN